MNFMWRLSGLPVSRQLWQFRSPARISPVPVLLLLLGITVSITTCVLNLITTASTALGCKSCARG